NQNRLQLLINFISIVFAAIIMCYGGSKLVLDTISHGQISPVLGIQMGFVYLAIPLSGCFMLVYLIRDITDNVRNMNAISLSTLDRQGE
ncbi:TRAP transporter small permease, partial [Rodentibacter pneumotropicus]